MKTKNVEMWPWHQKGLYNLIKTLLENMFFRLIPSKNEWENDKNHVLVILSLIFLANDKIYQRKKIKIH